MCACVCVCVKGINSDAWYQYTSSLFRAKDAAREVFLKPAEDKNVTLFSQNGLGVGASFQNTLNV